jgi:hypothetical protein
MSVFIPEGRPDNFSHRSLQAFIADNPGAAVVVRVPQSSRAAGVTANADVNRVSALIERALMQQGFNPRDRMLFENAVERMGVGDYAALGEATQTDLVFEVTHFTIDQFVVNMYSDELGRTHQLVLKEGRSRIPMTYLLYGFSIEIRVILLKDNLIAGHFKYYHRPCVNGCNITHFDRMRMTYTARPGSFRSVNEVSANLDREVADFISRTVIPSMFIEMAGGNLQQNISATNVQPQIQPQVQPTTPTVQPVTQPATSNVQVAAPPSTPTSPNVAELTDGPPAMLRLISVVPLLSSYDVYLDNNLIFRARFNKRATVPIHVFGPQKLSGVHGIFKRRGEFVVDIQPGGEYFISCGLGTVVSRPKFKLMDSRKGARQFGRLRD